jgi:single-stranded DNA-specific DHH superfamily exonuclease
MKTHVLYHRGDADGILSASILVHALKLTPDNSVLYPIEHSEPCPILDYTDSRGPKIRRNLVADDDQVFLLDFGYPAEEIHGLLLNHEKVTVLDHHRSTLEAVQLLPNGHPYHEDTPYRIIEIDPTRAACQIVWDEYMAQPRPWWLELIGWRDLGGPWQPGAHLGQASDAQALNSGLYAYAPLNPYALASFIDSTEPDTEIESMWQQWLIKGHDLAVSLAETAIAIVQAWDGSTIEINIKSPSSEQKYWVPLLCNIHQSMISEVGNQMSQSAASPGVAAICNRQPAAPHHFVLSFRSQPNAPLTAGQLAKLLKGGGHPQAAGCVLPEFPTKLNLSL